MSKLSALFLLSCALALAVAVAEPRLFQQQRGLQQQRQQQQQQRHHPYVFLSVPRGRANAGAIVRGFEIVEQPEDDDEVDIRDGDNRRRLAPNDADELDDDDDDEVDVDADAADEHINGAAFGVGFARNGQLVLVNGGNNKAALNTVDDEDAEDDDDDDDADADDDAEDGGVSVVVSKTNAIQQVIKTAKPTQMMVARDQAGSIMVPDGIIEIEGQSVVDEKTGKTALLVPRAALDAIPDGSVVALMDRSAAADASVGEERANRVVVRRRRTGSRRNVRRRKVNGGRRRRRGGQRRRRRPNVRVIRGGSSGGSRRRRRNRAGAGVRPVVLQG